MGSSKIFNIVMLGLAAALAAAPLFMKPGDEFAGTDSLAERAVAELRPGYEPWVRKLWEPPSPEVESLLFALQAAAGAGFIGYYFGSRKKCAKKSGDDCC